MRRAVLGVAGLILTGVVQDDKEGKLISLKGSAGAKRSLSMTMIDTIKMTSFT